MSSAFSGQVGNADWVTGIELTPDELQEQVHKLRSNLDASTNDMILAFIADASSKGVPLFTVLNENGMDEDVSASIQWPDGQPPPPYVDPTTMQVLDWATIQERGLEEEFRNAMDLTLLYGDVRETAATEGTRMSVSIVEGRELATDFQRPR